MEYNARIRLDLANDQIRRRIDEAAQARLRPARSSPSFRQSLGHSIIRIGERLAAEPSSFRPAQLR
jgi:hypothetical protein